MKAKNVSKDIYIPAASPVILFRAGGGDYLKMVWGLFVWAVFSNPIHTQASLKTPRRHLGVVWECSEKTRAIAGENRGDCVGVLRSEGFVWE